MRLPRCVTIIKDRDEFAYPAHVVLAIILEVTNASPTAVGLQWLKASAHARSKADADRASRGFEAAWWRSPDPNEFVTTLNQYLRPGEPTLQARIQSLWDDQPLLFPPDRFGSQTCLRCLPLPVIEDPQPTDPPTGDGSGHNDCK